MLDPGKRKARILTDGIENVSFREGQDFRRMLGDGVAVIRTGKERRFGEDITWLASAAI